MHVTKSIIDLSGGPRGDLETGPRGMAPTCVWDVGGSGIVDEDHFSVIGGPVVESGGRMSPTNLLSLIWMSWVVA